MIDLSHAQSADRFTALLGTPRKPHTWLQAHQQQSGPHVRSGLRFC
jgi:hypothetical protein